MAASPAQGEPRGRLLVPALLLLTGLAGGWWLGGRWLRPIGLDRFATPIAAAAERHGVAPALLRAVIRIESAADPQARSSAAAIGLMQLRLETAAERARALGLPEPSEASLTDPATNIDLGAAQLAYLLARFDRQLPLVLAAYNAGPARVDDWAARCPELGAAELIERMAARETRHYVRRVLQIYAAEGGR